MLDLNFNKKTDLIARMFKKSVVELPEGAARLQRRSGTAPAPEDAVMILRMLKAQAAQKAAKERKRAAPGATGI